MNPAAVQAPGWYGKLPALGDFARRRLGDGFVRPWDNWLAESIREARLQHGPSLDELLLTFPIWHFILPRRMIDEEAWIGVMVPSVDRVGRCFPLTIAQPMTQALGAPQTSWPASYSPTLKGIHEHVKPWAGAALAVLDNDDLDSFEWALIEAGRQRLVPAPAEPPVRAQSLDDLLVAIASRVATGHLAGESLWWSEQHGHAQARLLRWPGAPTPQLFLELLGSGP